MTSLTSGEFLHFVHGRDPDAVVTLRFDIDLSSVDFLEEYSLMSIWFLSAGLLTTHTMFRLSADDLMTGWVEIKLGWKTEENKAIRSRVHRRIRQRTHCNDYLTAGINNNTSLRQLNLWHPIFRWPGITSVEEIGAFGIIDFLYPSVRSASQAAYLGGARRRQRN